MMIFRLKIWNINQKIQLRIIIGLNENSTSLSIRIKRLLVLTCSCILLFIILIGRLVYLQFIIGSDLKESVYHQQTKNLVISPTRGTIYDSTGKQLAVSAPVDTVTINPRKNFIF